MSPLPPDVVEADQQLAARLTELPHNELVNMLVLARRELHDFDHDGTGDVPEMAGVAADAFDHAMGAKQFFEAELAKEKARWWPHPWQAALMFLGAVMFICGGLAVLNAVMGEWWNVAGAVFLMAMIILLVYLSGRRGPNDPPPGNDGVKLAGFTVGDMGMG